MGTNLSDLLNRVHHSECVAFMKTLPDNCIDSIVTDPPYELGFMGKSWDNTGIANSVEMRGECLRILKPGGHLLSFSGTRTYHRMACAIEDAGFEVRDMIEWVYGSGFPKSLNIGKAVDKLQGNERKIIGYKEPFGREGRNTKPTGNYNAGLGGNYTEDTKDLRPIYDSASEWEGWGTALKPAHEPICMARKPLSEKTVALNVLKYGTGGINIDESRVGTTGARNNGNSKGTEGSNSIGVYGKAIKQDYNMGRFPANLIHDNSEEVRECFPETKSTPRTATIGGTGGVGVSTNFQRGSETSNFGDSGNASRFFKSILYYPKSSKAERNIGLDGQVLISIMGSYLFPIATECTEKPDQNQLHLLDIEASQQKGGLECEIKIKKGKDLNISLFEKLTTDQYLNECKSIISTTTGGTMILAILNWLRHCITKEYTVDVNGEIEFGENLVENAEGGKKLTTTIKGKIEILHDAKNVVSSMQITIKEKENRNFHSTVKPIALMEYLIKMVTREGGIVFDPFTGSGTTLVSAKKNGFQYLGTEMTDEYIPIIEARLNATELEEEEIIDRGWFG